MTPPAERPPASYPVPPDSVYVWRGFRSAAKTYDQFAQFLGSVFVPACALLQPAVGLRAYLPTMVPQAGKPEALPDQTALMFWATPESHDLANKAIAVRIYQNLHGDAYDMARSHTPEVPVSIAAASGALVAEQPYFLLDQPADWMLGGVHHLVGARRADLSPADFLAQAYAWAAALRARPPAGVDGVLVCCGDDYAVAWVHAAQRAPELGAALDGLAALTVPVLRAEPRSLELPAGLWSDWPGLDLTRDTCLNIQLARPQDTTPVAAGKTSQPGPPSQPIRPIEHFEVPHLALWKSCVAEVLARHTGDDSHAAGIDSTHPLMQATDRYCRAMQANEPLEKPPAHSDDELAVHAYLASLHHRKAHARIAGDAALEADLERQTQEYKFGNPLWQQMFVQYFEYYWQYPYHEGGQPQYRSWQAADGGKGDLQYGVIEWKLPARARIAIVGDIGTGTDVAAAVLVAALRLKPDAILHVGDVYYSGTEHEMKHRLVGLIRAAMRSEGVRVPFFTVPGNHEYFTGAGPYLRTLDAGALAAGPGQRQAASYFCLRTEDDGWQLLGLDTGYHGHYMNVPPAAQQAALDQLHLGKVGKPAGGADPHWPADANPYFRNAAGGELPIRDTSAPVDQVTVRPDELAWHLDKLAGFAGRSILLSHHQLYSALDVCGVAQRQVAGADGRPVPDPADFNRAWINTGLWRQFGPMFGDRIAAWIWGHEHNLGVFQDGYRPADWPTGTAEATQVFKTLPKGRCAGHSAIPVAESEGPYAQKYPVPLVRPDVKLDVTDGWYHHGFQLLELAGAGRPARLSYFQVSGADPTPLPIYVEPVA